VKPGVGKRVAAIEWTPDYSPIRKIVVACSAGITKDINVRRARMSKRFKEKR